MSYDKAKELADEIEVYLMEEAGWYVYESRALALALARALLKDSEWEIIHHPEPSTKQDAPEAALAPYVDEIAQKVVDGLKVRQGGREANQQEISNLIGILAAPFVATSTNTAANKRLKELMGL